MNVGAMTAGFLLDAVRGHFKDVATSKLVAKEVALPILGPRMMTAYRMITSSDSCARASRSCSRTSSAEASTPKP